jgi:hypothetical protein
MAGGAYAGVLMLHGNSNEKGDHAAAIVGASLGALVAGKWLPGIKFDGWTMILFPPVLLLPLAVASLPAIGATLGYDYDFGKQLEIFDSGFAGGLSISVFEFGF